MIRSCEKGISLLKIKNIIKKGFFYVYQKYVIFHTFLGFSKTWT